MLSFHSWWNNSHTKGGIFEVTGLIPHYVDTDIHVFIMTAMHKPKTKSVRTFVNCRYIFGTKIQDSCKTQKTLSELNKTNSMNSICSTISFF